MSRPLGPDACRLLDGRNIAHLATLMPDGAPKVEPVWVQREGDLVLVATDARSIKATNTTGDPRVALSVTAADDPYDQLLIRGRVVEVRCDDEMVVLDRLAVRYLGRAFPRRRWSGRIVLVIEADIARAYRSPLSQHAPRRQP